MKPSLSLVATTLLVLATLTTSCKNKQEAFPEHARPQWQAIDTSDLESSMTVTGALPDALQANADTADLVAAFCNGECWGVTNIERYTGTTTEESSGKAMFFLYITRPRSFSSNQQAIITLKYYCAKTKYIYVQESIFEFVVDNHFGSLDEPLIPDFSTQE